MIDKPQKKKAPQTSMFSVRINIDSRNKVNKLKKDGYVVSDVVEYGIQLAFAELTKEDKEQS